MFMAYRTIDELYDHVADRFGQTQCRFPIDNTAVSMEQLAVMSRRYAAGLARRGVKKGDLVGCLFPNSAEFLTTFFAILRLGAVPTALPQPASASALLEFGRRIQAILHDGNIRHVVVHKRFAEMAAMTPPGVTALEFNEQLAEDAEPPARSHGPDDLAFIQYTSGSTSAPKGVALSHGNIIAGLKAIVEGSKLCVSDIVAQWLPLYHDMGLFGMLAALSNGATVCVWPPTAFIRNPGKWLRGFSDMAATVYTGPNFSYEYLLENVSESDLAQLDLRPWRVAFNGAESINAHSMTRFMEYFGRAGFRPEAMFTVYGLAEATLAVSFPPLGRAPRVHWVDRDLLANEGKVHFTDRADGRARGIVAVGRAVLDHEVRLCTDDGEPLGDGSVGEIQVRGPAVMRGYLNKPEITAETFQNGWLKTGDMGYISEGDLFVTGRKKELIIVHGENYYPQDVEAALQDVPDIYRNRCIAVAITDDRGDRLSVLAETSLEQQDALAGLAGRVQSTISKRLGLANVDVHLLKRRSLQRTTSGKHQRLLMARQLRSNELGDAILFSLTTGN
jgi:acyl-CoA synthetase (AMP-forming)/AMP-acid ligase II